ncbi:DnaA-homolog protein hda [Kingella potus]|uniref:DnaA-homolog protein hda n=1 Tax=Kingella potus TaxID=265175 RepID=A0A377R0D2_9NEIS|nr:DnaA regulatory inactivator Hda [Kingella potus]STR00288.1 DnaA-homolog protein hda [Kingella potus]
MKQLIFDFARRDYPGFDKFLGAANRELVFVLQQAQERFVYVWGAPGTGKSHLLRAWAAQAAGQGADARYIDADAEPLEESALEAAYLAVDQADRLDADGQALLFEVFNRFRNAGSGRLLLSADLPPAMLAVREDLRTRMGYCLVYDIKPLSDEEKIAALAEMARARQLDLDDGIFRYLLDYRQRDMDSLVRMLDTLCLYAATTRRRLTLPLLRRLLKQQETL